MNMRVELHNDQSGEVFPNNCSILVMVEYLLNHRLDRPTLHFITIFVTLLKQRPNSLRTFSQNLLKIIKIMYG